MRPGVARHGRVDFFLIPWYNVLPRARCGGVWFGVVRPGEVWWGLVRQGRDRFFMRKENKNG